MDSASKTHLGISAAPVPLLIRGAAFQRLADTMVIAKEQGVEGVEKKSTDAVAGEQRVSSANISKIRLGRGSEDRQTCSLHEWITD